MKSTPRKFGGKPFNGTEAENDKDTKKNSVRIRKSHNKQKGPDNNTKQTYNTKTEGDSRQPQPSKPDNSYNKQKNSAPNKSANKT